GRNSHGARSLLVARGHWTGGTGGCRAAGPVVRSTSSPRAPPRSGASAWPPIPRDGGRSPPRLWRGRLSRRGRPALRGALRLVGFAPYGTRLPRPAPTSRITGAVYSVLAGGRGQFLYSHSSLL